MSATFWTSWLVHICTCVCDGDSGGSKTFKENVMHYIRGIVSVTAIQTHTYSCNTVENVAQYLPWIHS